MKDKQDTITKHCIHHGLTEFGSRKTGTARCRLCQKEAVIKRRRLVKEKLVAECGGSCQVCGYSKCAGAMDFHHPDSSDKEFGVSAGGNTKSFAVLLEEAKKCVLLCCRCHREHHYGVNILP